MDILSDINMTKRVETLTGKVFKFQLGFDAEDIDFRLLFQRVKDAQKHFASSPLSSVAEQLEKETIVSSIFGTDNIEGGELTEQETAEVLELSPEEVQSIQQKRVVDIKQAYDFIKDQAKEDGWQLTFKGVLEVHRLISGDLDDYRPATLRDNPKEIKTQVGNIDHGGVYTPPQLGKDIEKLLIALLNWNQELIKQDIPALIRAPLVHLYFELIHPFWDGNGRVGRVIEAGILYADGFRYAPFSQAKYYLKNIHRYFTLFNISRKASEKKKINPNTDFVSFFLEGMFETIEQLQSRANVLNKLVLFDAALLQSKEHKKINGRQFRVVKIILKRDWSTLNIKLLPEYQVLYESLTDKTKSRDMKKLFDLGLLVEIDKKIYPGFYK